MAEGKSGWKLSAEFEVRERVCFRPEGPASAHLNRFPVTRYSLDLKTQYCCLCKKMEKATPHLLVILKPLPPAPLLLQFPDSRFPTPGTHSRGPPPAQPSPTRTAFPLALGEAAGAATLLPLLYLVSGGPAGDPTSLTPCGIPSSLFRFLT